MENKRKKDNKTRHLTIASMLLAGAVAAQLAGRAYPEISKTYVGPVINAIILLAVYYAKPKLGFIVSILTPILALILGQLASPMAPMVPFIIVGNLLYALCFSLFNKSIVERIISSVIGSALKYGFFVLTLKLFVPLFMSGIKEPVKDKMAQGFGMVQLIAALAGSVIAVVLIEILNRIFTKEKKYY